MSRPQKRIHAVARQKRANGEASRQRILDAAAEIASERGYEGTSIALVSARSGLPASSIYWHFEDKDHLLARVIERSFNRWLEGMSAWVLPKEGVASKERFRLAMRRTGRALLESPDFLRLGLMLALERRPKEASARTLFLQVRAEAYRRMLESYGQFFKGLDRAGIRALATISMAVADGLFIAREIEPDRLDFEEAFDLVTTGLIAMAEQLQSRIERSRTASARG
ncbi:MAG: helix-turn-helix domain-containing protein [Candidatus Binatus sp.]